MPASPPNAQPEAGLQPLARLAQRAAQMTGTLMTPRVATRWRPLGDLPAYVPVLGVPDRDHRILRVDGWTAGGGSVSAPPLPPTQTGHGSWGSGAEVYADPIKEPVPGVDSLVLWEQVARFGISAVYGSMRSLSTALSTAVAAAGLPSRDAHLEGLRRHWLVDWVLEGDRLWPTGPADHPQLLAALAQAVLAVNREASSGPYGDADLRSRVWDLVAGPGPDAGQLTRRQIAGRRLMLLDPVDPYLRERACPVPTWSPPGVDPEQSVLDALPGDLQLRLEGVLSPRDRAVLRTYLAMDGAATWAQAAALVAPDGDAAALGDRVRRRLKRYGLEDSRRRGARATSAATASAWTER
ncbi:hypothetical protein [Streptacidiphilus sp. EB103A]|uniref:hypothetical protein n=1 Tax=Streptacidiphilus sp. EB103A TaxID=3156275 RepID=UPI003519A784